MELDAVDHGDAGDIRFRLVQHLLRDGSRRGAARFHVACADRGGNVELFMQAGFARYGEERLLSAPPDAAASRCHRTPAAAAHGHPPGRARRRARSSAACTRAVTPAPVARLEGYRLPDWERHRHRRGSVPRTSLTPILRFADVEAFVQDVPAPPARSARRILQLGVAKEHQPHYLRVSRLPEHDPSALIRFGLAIIGERSGAGSARRDRGDCTSTVSCPACGPTRRRSTVASRSRASATRGRLAARQGGPRASRGARLVPAIR